MTVRSASRVLAMLGLVLGLAPGLVPGTVRPALAAAGVRVVPLAALATREAIDTHQSAAVAAGE